MFPLKTQDEVHFAGQRHYNADEANSMLTFLAAEKRCSGYQE
jgi:hypothetical protein